MKCLLLATHVATLLGFCYASPISVTYDLTSATSVNLVPTSTPCLYAVTPIVQDGITKASWAAANSPLTYTNSAVKDLYSLGRPYNCLIATGAEAMPSCVAYAIDAWASTNWATATSICPSKKTATLIPDGSIVVIAPTTTAKDPYATIDPISGQTVVPAGKITQEAAPSPTASIS